MCLDRLYSKEDAEEYVDMYKFPFKGYKLMDISNGSKPTGIFTATSTFKFKVGKNVAISDMRLTPSFVGNLFGRTDRSYRVGFHFFFKKSEAKKFASILGWNEDIIIKQITIEKPEDITAVGEEFGQGRTPCTVGVTQKFTMKKEQT